MRFGPGVWKTAGMRVSAKADYALRAVIEMASVADLATGDLPPVVAALTEDDDAWQPH